MRAMQVHGPLQRRIDHRLGRNRARRRRWPGGLPAHPQAKLVLPYLAGMVREQPRQGHPGVEGRVGLPVHL
ncbi:MAG: hypothetical protein RL479_1410, partial [Verrucomicrobiota bacterium]